MLLGILPISVVCLLLAYSGWVPPDVKLSSSTQLIPFRVSYSTEIYSTPSITSLILFKGDTPSLTLGYCDITRPPDDMCGLEISDNDEISTTSQLALMFDKNARCPQLRPPQIHVVKMTKIEKTNSALVVNHDKNGLCYETNPDETDSDEDLVCSRKEVRLDGDHGDTENHNLVILVIFLHLILLQSKYGLLGRLYSSFGMGFSMTSGNMKKLKDLDIELDLEYSEFAEKIKFLKNQIDDKKRHLQQKEIDLTTARTQLIEFETTATIDRPTVKQLNESLRLNKDRRLNIKKMRPRWQWIAMGNGWISRRRARLA